MKAQGRGEEIKGGEDMKGRREAEEAAVAVNRVRGGNERRVQIKLD